MTIQSANLRKVLVVAFVGMMLVTLLGCTAEEDTDVSSPSPTNVAVTELQTPVNSPTVTAVIPTTVAPTPTQSSTAIKKPELESLAAESIVIDGCSLAPELVSKTGFGEGTAPAPTPTRVPDSLFRPTSTVAREVDEFWKTHASIVTLATNSNSAFEAAWEFELSRSEQSAQVHVLGAVLSQLCSSVAIEPVPLEIQSEVIALAEAIRARHAWASLAAERLICCDDAQTDFMDIGRVATFENLELQSSILRNAVNGLSGTQETSKGVSVSTQRMNIEFDIHPSHVLVRNSVDVLISTPVHETNYLNLSDLGPAPWSSGASVRIRRIRNRENLEIQSAVENLFGLISKWGEPKLLPQSDAILFPHENYEYPLEELGWSGRVTLFNHDGHTFVAESMCRIEATDICFAQQAVVESIRPLEAQ
jgi:hypothetical protein